MEVLTPAKRDIPMIAGSSAAFVVIIVALVLVIIGSCTAAIYILRQDMAYYRHEQSAREAPGPYTRPRSIPLLGPLAAAVGLAGPRAARTDGAKETKASGGWMAAASASDWDLERSATAHTSPGRHPGATAARGEMMEQRTATRSPQPSFSTAAMSLSPPPSGSRVYIAGTGLGSDGSLPRSPRGYSPYSSEPPSPLGRHSARSMCSPPSPLSTSFSAAQSATAHTTEHSNGSADDLSIGNPFVDVSSSAWSTKTFRSGSKFVEGL